MQVLRKPTIVGAAPTYDIEVSLPPTSHHGNYESQKVPIEGQEFSFSAKTTHSYQYVTSRGNRIVSHNSVSLLAGATPGVHWPIARTYLRRIRLDSTSELIKPLADAGYPIEPCIGSEKNTVVVTIPVRIDSSIRTQKEVSIWEKVQLAIFMQRYWSDNQVSVTIDFDPATEGKEIANILNYAQYELKSISFLPRFDHGTPYPQMPYEEISDEKYDEMMKTIKPIDLDRIQIQRNRDDEKEEDRYCDSDTCFLRAENKRSKLEEGNVVPLSKASLLDENDFPLSKASLLEEKPSESE